MAEVIANIVIRRIAALLGCKSRDIHQVRRDMLAAGEIKRVEVDKKGRRVWTLL